MAKAAKTDKKKGVKLTKSEQEKLKAGLLKASAGSAVAARPSAGTEAAAVKRCW